MPGSGSTRVSNMATRASKSEHAQPPKRLRLLSYVVSGVLQQVENIMISVAV